MIKLNRIDHMTLNQWHKHRFWLAETDRRGVSFH